MVKCKYCRSSGVVKFGTYNGRQLYFCKCCNRKFRAGNEVFHMGVPGGYIGSTLEMYYNSRSLKDICFFLKQKYDYLPSKSLILNWINKYTLLAVKQFQYYNPEIGDSWMIWVADKALLKLDGRNNIYLYDVMDLKSRFLLSSYVSESLNLLEVEKVVTAACECAGKIPRKIDIDRPDPFLAGMVLTLGKDSVKIPPIHITSRNSSELMRRFSGRDSSGIDLKRSFKTLGSLVQFVNGWKVYYNYFKKNDLPNEKTPADDAGIVYDIKSWNDFVLQSSSLIGQTPGNRSLWFSKTARLEPVSPTFAEKENEQVLYQWLVSR